MLRTRSRRPAGATKEFCVSSDIIYIYSLEKKKLIFFLTNIIYMPSAWITHVKSYAKEHNISYREALKKASSTYKKI